VGWPLGILAAAALLAVGAITVVMLTRSPTAPSIGEAGTTTPLYTADELAVMRLVARGYVPAETLEGDPYRLKRLVNQGLVPRAALEPAPALILPLYSAEERVLMAIVNQGLVPKQALDTRTFLIKRLVNQGLIPRQTLLRAG
jgi:hypothetical protein